MSTAVTPSRLLTVAETAELLRVSVRTVRRLIDNGTFPAPRVGAQLRIDPDELREWLHRDRESAA